MLWQQNVMGLSSYELAIRTCSSILNSNVMGLSSYKLLLKTVKKLYICGALRRLTNKIALQACVIITHHKNAVMITLFLKFVRF